MRLATTVFLALVSAAAGAAPQSTAKLRPREVLSGEAAARVDDYLSRLVRHGFSGAVLIATDGKVVLKRAYGMANRETGLAYDVDMVSCIGSVTKQFTGAAIVKLEMMGRLSTSDPISKYLPGVPPDKTGITVHHLLTHTAGFSGDLGGSDEEPIARDALVAKVLAAPLIAKPGEQFEYSNEGFALAAAIVERVSGQGYEAFLREHLFLPADMTNTGYQAPAWPIERLPVGYGPEGRPWGRTYKNGWLPDGPGWYLRGNGGIHSTLDDLYRWHTALERAGILSADALKKYLTGYAPTPAGDTYAYGWGVQKTRRGTSVISHNGGNGFLFTDFRRYIDENVVIIAMTNEPVIPAPQLAPREIESLFFDERGGRPVVMPPVPVAVPRAAREQVAGVYALDGGATLTVTVTPDGLAAASSDPALFGGLAGLAAPGGRFAELESKSMALMDAGAKDDFRPLFEAFNDERPFEVVQGNQRRFWAGWRSRLGEFERLELLGTAMVQGDPAVTIRLRFLRGSQIVQLAWGPRRLAGFIIAPEAPPRELTAESPTAWVFYSYRAPAPVRVVFDGAGVTVTGASATIKGKKGA